MLSAYERSASAFRPTGWCPKARVSTSTGQYRTLDLIMAFTLAHLRHVSAAFLRSGDDSFDGPSVHRIIVSVGLYGLAHLFQDLLKSLIRQPLDWVIVLRHGYKSCEYNMINAFQDHLGCSPPL